MICSRLGHVPPSREPPLFGGHDANKVANHHTRSEHAATSDKIATVADLTAQISLDYHRRVPSKGVPPPWIVEERPESFIIRDATG